LAAVLASCGAPVACARQAPLSPAQETCLQQSGGESAETIAACTGAIEAKGMAPAMLAAAYNARGEARCHIGEYGLAIGRSENTVV